MTDIRFRTVEDFPGWAKAEIFFAGLFERFAPEHVLEIGSGAHPTFPPRYVENAPFSYTTSDVDHIELDKAGDAYSRVLLDVCSPQLPESVIDNYDFIFSRMVNEHVADGRRYYANLYRMLRPGGVTVHCFSTLYALPFLLNRLVPEIIASPLLDFFNPRNRYEKDKFEARYSWSRGPTKTMIRRYQTLGYEVLQYDGFFGHDYYQERVPWLHALEKAKSQLLCSYIRLPMLTSYACVVLQKPTNTTR
jgi:SAM-dependent methyltransferase